MVADFVCIKRNITMNRLYRIVIPSFLCLGLIFSASACNFTRGSDLSETAAVRIAYRYLETEKLIPEPARELPLRNVTTDELGLVHIDFEHVVDGVPVWGENFKVHLDRESRVYRADGKFTPGLAQLKITPRLSVAQAQSFLLKQYPNGQITKSKLVILPGLTPPTLAYEFLLEQNSTAQTIFLDANTGRIVMRLDGVTLNPDFP